MTLNLAKAGFKVLLLEAGGKNEPPSYSVPVFHQSLLWGYTMIIAWWAVHPPSRE